MIKYKLTDQNMQTYGGFQWEIGKWYEATGKIEQGLCTDGWLHCYDSPLLAILHNPIHGRIRTPRLFEAETRGAAKDNNGMKCGYRIIRLVREIPVPEVTTAQRVKYAILCAKQVYSDPDWNKWADDWLLGKDRTQAYTVKGARIAAAIAAHSATGAVFYAARAAIKANTNDTYIVDAAFAAIYAVDAAVNAVDATCAAVDAACAADVACIVAAACAAEAAAHAVGAVDAVTKNVATQIDLIDLAEKAMK